MTKIQDIVDEVVEDGALEVQDHKVHPTDPKWVDHVLDELSDHELLEGNPTTDGLRRVTEKLYGEIIRSDTEILEIPAQKYTGKVTAKHTLIIRKFNGTDVVVSACVDVLGDTLPAPFNKHLVATACTKAEGKALRRALKIRVQTAEELSSENEEEFNTDEPINDQQIVAIKMLCKRNDVDLVKFVTANSDNPKTIRDIKNLEGRLMINKLSGFQREGTPDDLAGYNDNWEETFGAK
jgi:hypothetical protein